VSAVEQLARRMYPALAAGDRAALGELLADDFEGSFCQGLPGGAGGVHRGAAAALRDGWWAIGRAFAIAAEPEEWIACADGRLLVRGRYRGSARATGAPLDAEFAHLWTARDGRIAALWQLTDSAAWVAAVQDEAAAS
jgi:ketosteroid isomerase-like protein